MSSDFFKLGGSSLPHACGIPMLDVQGGRQLTATSSAFQERCISPSFVPLLKEMIPRHDTALGFGGSWFWNCYLNALHGEDVFLDLKGTGVNLSEDSLDTQVALRRKLASAEDAKRLAAATEHCSAKVEALCALCLSVVLHVSHRPMLEREQGPQALVLCATKDQCDELYALLDRFGSALHLVSHNLFGAYPPMPSEKRADIVVGTLPLWESVARLSPLAALDGLEEILYQVSHNSRWTSSSTRWRPYSLDFVTQLVFLDLDLQHALGYGPMLQRLFVGHKRPVIAGLQRAKTKAPQGGREGGTTSSGLPHRCQMYCLVGGGCKQGKKLFETLRVSRERRGDGTARREVVRIALRDTLPQADVSEEHAIGAPRKRRRDEDEDDVAVCEAPAAALPRLVVHNALSHSRLMLDAAAFDEFAVETKRRAQSFWSRFEAAPSSAADGEGGVGSVVDVQLAYGCIDSDCCTATNARTWFVAETLAIVTPVGDGATHPTRTALLMRHLDDELSGQIFDGSVVQCFLQRGAMTRVAAGAVMLHSVFSATARSISQEPLFLRLVGEEGAAEEAGNATGNADTDQGTVNARTHRARLRQRAQEASSAVKGTTSFPLHKFLALSEVELWRTVLVFRQIAPSLSVFCDAQSDAKPTALLYLEECCQYGKVVSYFIFEQRYGGNEERGCVHFFVEFAAHEAAAEAARQFSLRFTSGGNEAENHVRVKLFSNELYYEGVAVEAQKQRGAAGDGGATRNHSTTTTNNDLDDGDEDDEDEDDLMGVSLLGE
ncbi:uncharacterized protein Tco025E_08025 [Trypanosoma conorhini]|uniref:Uncharacterized protein n=1 Tax=Trypanosoma conorhini TaxID=83891 RepID=A0A422NHA3_9TRYP|nr:uncharacterized protein Tco025E_08025 [Trypanosoma conorhini]RNF04853.1 hypothetical protein Tco025E_08025 [Trypanosoma conorhini]